MASTARIDELKKKFDENPRRYFAPLANEFRKAGDLEQAIMICEEFLPQQPGHMSGHIVYGQALYESGRLAEARTVFETALTLDPENLIALRHLGDIARGQGDVDTARRWYDRVLEADPRNEEIQGIIAGLSESPPPTEAAGVGRSADAAAEPSEPRAPRAESTAQATTQAAVQPFAPAMPSARPAAPVVPPAIPAVPPPIPASAAGALDTSLVDLDSRDMFTLGATGASGAPPAATTHSADDPRPDSAFERLSLEGLEATVGASAPRQADASRAEGLEPTEFTPPTGPLDRALSLEGALEPGEFSAPPSASVAPLAGLEETSIGAFEARDERAAEPPSVELPWLDLDAPAASDEAPVQPPPELPPEVIAAEAELIDEREGGATMGGEFPPAPPAPPAPSAAATDARRLTPTGRNTPSSTPAPFVTETMAELYLKQGFREQALDVYTLLLAASPDSARLRARVAELQPAPVVDDGPSVREFFARIATRRAGERAAASVPPADDDFASFDLAATASASPASDAASQPTTAMRQPEAAASAHAPMPSGLDRAAAAQSGGGSIDALFGNRAVGSSEDSAASALAQAFGGAPEPPPITGRPARAANGELSLDSVFRDGPPRPPRGAPSFSFDQFFSEGAAVERAPTGPPPTPTQGVDTQAESGDRGTDDIEQFNSWLQGLKQR
jgi:tetratricopeptide (TPR) repeat protein